MKGLFEKDVAEVDFTVFGHRMDVTNERGANKDCMSLGVG